MTHNPKKYLTDMLDSCRFLLDLTAGKSMRDYQEDRMFRNAVDRDLQNIGEALRQLQSRDAAMAARITDHERIIRCRHALVHGYDSVRPDLVWDIIEMKLPALRTELEALLESS